MGREIQNKCVLTLFVPSSLVNELALTARKMYADEAKSSGLVRYRNRNSFMAAGANLKPLLFPLQPSFCR